MSQKSAYYLIGILAMISLGLLVYVTKPVSIFDNPDEKYGMVTLLQITLTRGNPVRNINCIIKPVFRGCSMEIVPLGPLTR